MCVFKDKIHHLYEIPYIMSSYKTNKGQKTASNFKMSCFISCPWKVFYIDHNYV